MNMKYAYGSDELPEGFRYPDKFLKDASEELYPWIFIEAESEVGRLLYSIGMRDGRVLIPFASLENGDGDAACFDGRDTSGNPPIIMMVLDGSGRSYSFKDYEEWLNEAKKAAALYRRLPQ